MNELFGTPCIIAERKVQKKTSKYKLINWFYKKIYGYEYQYALPEGTDIIYLNGEFVFRSTEVFDETMKTLRVKIKE